MNPKEKAQQLIEEFENATTLNLTLDEQTTQTELIKHAIICALIMVNELIKTGQKVDFWQNVKAELKAYKPENYIKNFIENLKIINLKNQINGSTKSSY